MIDGISVRRVLLKVFIGQLLLQALVLENTLVDTQEAHGSMDSLIK